MPSASTVIFPSSNPFLNAIQWGGWLYTDGSIPGTNITYYFSPAGTNLNTVYGTTLFGVSQNWTSSQMAAFQAALQTWANVADITFTQVFTAAEADLVEFVY